MLMEEEAGQRHDHTCGAHERADVPEGAAFGQQSDGTDDQADLQERFGGMADWIRPSALMGSTAEIVDRVAAYRDAGADWVNLALRAPFDIESVDRFATEVVPALR